MSDATTWLTQLGLERYAAIFAENDIDEDVLLSVPTGDRYPKLLLDPEVRRARTLQALVEGFESLARRRPLLMLMEDVHWAKPWST